MSASNFNPLNRGNLRKNIPVAKMQAKQADSAQKTKIRSAIDAAPFVGIAAAMNTAYIARYATRINRGLQAGIKMSPAAMNRFAV